MALNSKDSDRSIIALPHIGAHLDYEAEGVLSFPLKLIDGIYKAPIGSEDLVSSLTRSDQVLAYLKKFGISERQILNSKWGASITNEPLHQESEESLPLRGIVSLSAALAIQEVNKLSYRIGGRHLVEAIRRTPTS